MTEPGFAAKKPGGNIKVIQPSNQLKVVQFRGSGHQRRDRPRITDYHRELVNKWLDGHTDSNWDSSPARRREFGEFFEEHAQRTPVDLWRGIKNSPDSLYGGHQEREVQEALGLSSWSENPDVAKNSFARGEGIVRHLASGMARGLRVLDYVPHSNLAQGEQEWIVRPGMFHDRRAARDFNPLDPHEGPELTDHMTTNQALGSFLAAHGQHPADLDDEQHPDSNYSSSWVSPKPQAPAHNPVTGEPYDLTPEHALELKLQQQGRGHFIEQVLQDPSSGRSTFSSDYPMTHPTTGQPLLGHLSSGGPMYSHDGYNMAEAQNMHSKMASYGMPVRPWDEIQAHFDANENLKPDYGSQMEQTVKSHLKATGVGAGLAGSYSNTPSHLQGQDFSFSTTHPMVHPESGGPLIGIAHSGTPQYAHSGQLKDAQHLHTLMIKHNMTVRPWQDIQGHFDDKDAQHDYDHRNDKEPF